MTKMLVDVRTAATQLSVSRSTIYQLMQRGELQCVHVGTAVRIPVEELEKYVARLRADHVADRGAPQPVG